MIINILGVNWAIIESNEADDDRLRDCDGCCDWTTREIVVEHEIQGNLYDMDAYIKKVKRHEIVHAFLAECGLHECSGETDAWAMNETMVDWFAQMGERIYKAWLEADAV